MPHTSSHAATRRALPDARQATHLAGCDVLIVGMDYAPQTNGIAPYTTALAEHLAAAAHSVTVWTGLPNPTRRPPSTPRPRGRRLREPRSPRAGGPRVVRLRHVIPRRQTWPQRAAYHLSFLFNCLTFTATPPPDLVVIVTPGWGAAMAGILTARRHRARSLVVVQGLHDEIARPARLLERYALTRADHVAMVSSSFRTALNALGVAADRLHLLPNWTQSAPVAESRQAARTALGWPRDGFVVAHVHDMEEHHDLRNVVQAARLLAVSRADLAGDVRIVLVGEGSQRDVLEHQAWGLNNIHFVQLADPDDVPLALAAADVLLINEHPGHGRGGGPGPLVSYLSAGRPVLAAVPPHGTTASELSRTGGAGVCVPAGDPAALAQTVLRLAASDDLRAEMSRAAVVHAYGYLGRQAATRRLDDVVDTLLSDRRPPRAVSKTWHSLIRKWGT